MSLQHTLWNQHNLIGIDIDETLAKTLEGMLFYAQGLGMLKHITSIEQIKKHDASGLGNNITPEEVGSIWEGYGKSTMEPDSVAPIEYSIEGVQKIYSLGKNISIVTARSNHEAWKVERTTRWIRSHFSFLTESEIHFVNHFSKDALPKSYICKENGITLMIDDAMENAHELCKNGISCILLEKPWNREIDFHHPLLYKVKDWQEIIHSIK